MLPIDDLIRVISRFHQPDDVQPMPPHCHHVTFYLRKNSWEI
ncbi:hypothetical protein F385_2089 [Pantoea agglomerans 299R]|nr:hypothetical protein F385_2089 [Pantoea agglomerans 299R]